MMKRASEGLPGCPQPGTSSFPFATLWLKTRAVNPVFPLGFHLLSVSSLGFFFFFLVGQGFELSQCFVFEEQAL
jgi:hypothetical protein